MTSCDQQQVSTQTVDLACVHRNIADELSRLHHATLEMQTTVSFELSQADFRSDALLSLQALDAHAQVLRDLSCILLILGQKTKNEPFSIDAFADAKILPSTAAAVFGADARTSRIKHTSGDVTLF